MNVTSCEILSWVLRLRDAVVVDLMRAMSADALSVAVDAYDTHASCEARNWNCCCHAFARTIVMPMLSSVRRDWQLVVIKHEQCRVEICH